MENSSTQESDANEIISRESQARAGAGLAMFLERLDRSMAKYLT